MLVFGQVINDMDNSGEGTQVESSTRPGLGEHAAEGFRALEFDGTVQCVARQDRDVCQLAEEAYLKVGGFVSP